jgi:hypothetical protein
VHWQEYDIEARRPDAIFVNNPYDGNVRNACIHPDYFCERLRGLTDLLVYIPYFITGDDVPEEFCTLPGCIHAHKVILESEKIRDKYIRVFGKAFGDRRGKTKEKFIALGSPKLDKVINAKREDFTLPAGFERLLRRPDGTAKKVVLYNTHMFAWLNGGEEYFKKLRSVFETFRSRDDVVLWWRPHPNTELNFRTMRPDLLGAYKALVGGYRRAGFGIYDDTQDLNRAIAHSDAYFGDGRSSLVFLYTQIGKPVFLQNGEITEALDPALRDELLHSDIVSFTFAPDGKGEWGFSVLCNALYRVRVDRAEAEYVSSVPEEENAVWLYSAPIRIGDKLLLPPAFARSWAIYDIKTGSWEKIPIPAEAMPTGIWKSAFGGAVHCDRYVLIYPGERGVFAKYDTESGAFTYYSEWYEAFQKYVKNADWGLFAGGAAIEGRIFLTSPQCNAVTELNPDDMSFKLHRAGAASNAYCGITYTKDAFWLLKFCAERDGKFKDGIVEWHPDTGESVEYADLPHTQDESRKGRGFTCAVPLGDDLYLFPWQADNIVKFNTGTKQSAVYPLDLGHDYFDRKAQEYDWAKDAAFPWVTRNVIVPYPWEKTVHTNPNLYLQLPYDYSLMELNLLDGAFGIKKWKILGTEKLLSSKDSLSPPPWHEYYGHTLDNFLNNVVLDKYSAGRLLKADKPKKDRAIGVNLGIAGQAIYDCVKESAGV